MDSIYVIKLNNKEYIEYFNDLIRIISLQFSIQFLYYINSSDNTQILSEDFILLIIYLILGISIYHLIFKKIITFSCNS